MSRPGLVRPAFVIALLTVLLVAVTGLLELTVAARNAIRTAALEVDLVSWSMEQEIVRLATAKPGAALSVIASNPRLRETMIDGLVRAPSIVEIGVIDPAGVVAAHTVEERIGAEAVSSPELPESPGFFRAATILWTLKKIPSTYQSDTNLMLGDRPFATIRVVVAGAFLWEAVKSGVTRGIGVALVVSALGILVGLGFYRVTSGRIRILERGVAAIRAGRYDESPLPEAGIGEFARLATELNLLARQIRDRSGGAGVGEDGRADGESRTIVELSRMVSGVTHEIGNQLYSVQLALNPLREAERLRADEVRKLADDAVETVDQLDRTVRGFLKMVRMRPLAVARHSPARFLGEVRADLAADAAVAGVDLDVDAPPELVDAPFDAEVVKQALQNLVRNSIEALDGREGKVVLRGRIDGSDLVIVVDDDGPGFPAAAAGRAFDLYFTTKEGGSGIGLALVHQAAERHGGSVSVGTSPRGGATVTLRLPLGPAEEGAAPPAAGSVG